MRIANWTACQLTLPLWSFTGLTILMNSGSCTRSFSKRWRLDFSRHTARSGSCRVPDPTYPSKCLYGLSISRRWWYKQGGRLHHEVVHGVVYTMDHEVVPRPGEICVEFVPWPFRFTPRRDVKVITQFQILDIRILRPALFGSMVQRVLQWGRQKRCSCKRK